MRLGVGGQYSGKNASLNLEREETLVFQQRLISRDRLAFRAPALREKMGLWCQSSADRLSNH